MGQCKETGNGLKRWYSMFFKCHQLFTIWFELLKSFNSKYYMNKTIHDCLCVVFWCCVLFGNGRDVLFLGNESDVLLLLLFRYGCDVLLLLFATERDVRRGVTERCLVLGDVRVILFGYDCGVLFGNWFGVLLLGYGLNKYRRYNTGKKSYNKGLT